MAKLRISTQNRVKLRFTEESEWDSVQGKQWQVIRLDHDTFVLKEQESGLTLGSDLTIFIPSGQDLLQMDEHAEFNVHELERQWERMPTLLICSIISREPISDALRAYCKLPADKALTDPNQQRIFEELSPRGKT